MIQLVLVALLVFIWIFWTKWQAAPDDAARRNLVRNSMMYGLLALILLLAAMGRIHWLGAVFAALFPIVKFILIWVLRLFPALARIYRTHGAASGGTHGRSRVTSRFLKMSLDHETGALQGIVLQGPHEGTDLDQLGEVELKALHRHYRVEDPDSARLLESYLKRRFGNIFGDSSHTQDESQHRNESTDMSLSEAREILNLGQEATIDEVRSAHRRLIQKLHPDRGGSDYFAAKINQARDVLLRAMNAG